LRSVALFEQLGPGLVTGAADDDPSGIATYSQAGAQFGFHLLWTMVLTYPLMAAIQLVSAHIGRVTGYGLAKNMGELLPRGLVTSLVVLLFIANTINIGADLAAMGDGAELVLGRGAHLFTLLFAVASLLLQLFVPYRRYANFLKWITLTLLAYVALLFMVDLKWSAVLSGLVIPRIDGRQAIITLVAIFGTTISPYLFFWQSAQEVEEVIQDPNAEPLVEAPWQARREFRRMRIDTFAGMAVSNIVALCIMIGTAATLNAAGHSGIGTAADAAKALEPVAGRFAFLLFALGIIGTGLLAVPVLAGSAAYAIGESRGWKCGLEHKPWEAVGFYTIIGLATLIKALFYSAVINGFVAVPIMAAMMLVVARGRAMGKFVARTRLLVLGWLATAVMGAAALAMVIMQ
jgi:NRAMP (natural resistance-associated macrophage protein)-like metal ion transporter